MNRICSEPACIKLVYSRDLCRSHYNRIRRLVRHPEGVVPPGIPISAERLEQERKYLAGSLMSDRGTHCKYGHAFTAKNTYVHAKGYKVCKICRRAIKQRSKSAEVDMVSPIGPHNRDKTHCSKGHAFAEHGKPRQGGGRMCRLCTKQERRSRLYGLSQQQFDARVQEQGGKCAICRKTFTAAQQTHIDHDHKTLQVRGILCSRCNLALGLLDDDLARLRAAVDYLDRYRQAVEPTTAPDSATGR